MVFIIPGKPPVRAVPPQSAWSRRSAFSPSGCTCLSVAPMFPESTLSVYNINSGGGPPLFFFFDLPGLCATHPQSPPMETFACTDSDASSGAPPLLFASDLCLSLRLLTGRATLFYLHFALGSSSCTNIIIIPVDRFELAHGTWGNGVLFSGTQKFSAPIACTTLAVH